MMIGALNPYERTLETPGALALLAHDGRTVHLDIDRYLAACDDVDSLVLERCDGPVLDVGCGPGRFVHALGLRGVPALGVDIAATAVDLTRARGAAALRRDLFGRVPGEGRWATLLVMDGNVGIGGDLTRLLVRLAELLAASGRVIVETDEDPFADERLSVRFAREGVVVGPSFPWAVVGAQTLSERAPLAGFYVIGSWTAGGRSFVELGRSRTTRSR
jgi:SAM-dependent methyltransferase